jgi:hypothetical protein
VPQSFFIDFAPPLAHLPVIAALPREHAAPVGAISDTEFQFPITQGS